MLYQSERHERLKEIAWDEAQVRSVIQSIATDTVRHFNPDEYWAIHPLDRDYQPPTLSFKGLYSGAAGVFWALHYLQREGAIALDFDPIAYSHKLHWNYCQSPDSGEVVPSYFMGEVGILLVLWRFAANPEMADRLYELIQKNITNPTHEAFWAAPGTMLGALFMWEWTQEERWRDLFLQNADYLWVTWQYAPECNCFLWTQNLYGAVRKLTGPAHGYVGNLYALLRGLALYPHKNREELYRRCLETVIRTSQIVGNYANWCPDANIPPGFCKMLVQWCHGAPGMVTSLNGFPQGYDARMDQLLIDAGELTWQAGPLTKGSGLCHGTAGNGYAFLKLYQRTGEERWLQRSQAFGMHAIAQYHALRQQYPQGRYSLWTGDLGLAVYLWDVITRQPHLPTLDIL
jgi:lantibiotic modifying enzyme